MLVQEAAGDEFLQGEYTNRGVCNRLTPQPDEFHKPETHGKYIYRSLDHNS